MAMKKKSAAKKTVAKKVTKMATAKTSKKSVKATVKTKKVLMVPTVDTFKKVGKGKLKAVAPKAKPISKKIVTVVVKTAPSRPCKGKAIVKKVVKGKKTR